MNTPRKCQQCGKDFAQTFGGRPRKKCYDCVPARLNQKGSVVQKAQRAANPVSTVGKHAGKSAEPAAESSGRHCPECGSYPMPTSEAWPFCNPQHRARFAEKVADAKRGGPQPLNGKVKKWEPPKKQRPLERLRQRERIREDEERSKQISAAREKAASADRLSAAA